MVLRSHLCAIIQTASGELILSSLDHLHDLAPAETIPELSISALTPQEQQEVEDWLKVEVQEIKQVTRYLVEASALQRYIDAG